jgi:DNA polymerase III delta subunit
LPSKLIDTENELNKIFKKNCKKLNNAPATEKRKAAAKPAAKVFPEITDDPDEIPIYSKKETAQEKADRMKQNAEDEEQLSWDMRKKIADAKRAERNAEISQLQVDKLMGSLMPVDLVEAILKVNVQDIFKTFENSCVNLASIYCDILAGGDRTKLAEITKKLRIELSSVIERVKQSAAQEIENVVEDYAESRSRGEKK